jgi:NAD(P)-dependent dehydrogenase (short-subunit alcohol dehydrogenase family)
MLVEQKVCVVTGAASGIGRATALAFAQAGARAVVLADITLAPMQALAKEIESTTKAKALAVETDVGGEEPIKELVKQAKQHFGRVDVFFSNAGILGKEGGLELEDPLWDAMWRIHSMAHVWAARAVVPGMVEQGGGAFVITASAAGLLNIVESAPYAVTKHAAVAFAEWLRIAYGRKGVQVACLCPQAVRTGMVTGDGASAGSDGILPAEQVAADVIATIGSGQFLVLPHPKVADYFRAKANDYDRWLGGMQKRYLRYVDEK